ncbi:MAG: Maf family protein [Thermoanaerobaculia bacterium]
MTAAKTPRLVLASASPRRSALLFDLELEFLVRPPHTDESPRPLEGPIDLVARLALEKARARVETDDLVLAADTIVVIDGEILGKPADEAEARDMLRRLSGRDHEVYTGVALVDGSAVPARLASRVERTKVRIRTMTAAEIAAYVAGGEPMDKAGAYAIQGWGAVYVEAITGNYTNVVGLPIPAVEACFRELGFAIESFRRQLTGAPSPRT